MHAACPHCDKDIEIVGTTEITEDFGLTPNMIQHAIFRKRFPEPWIKFNNRALWLKSTIAAYQADISREKSRKAARVLVDAFALLSEEERARIIKEIGGLDPTPDDRKVAA